MQNLPTPLPDLPEGYSRWEDMGEAWRTETPEWNSFYLIDTSDPYWFPPALSITEGMEGYRYIRAIKES